LCPFASRFPFEVWILPKTHSSHYEDLQKADASNLATLLKSVLARHAAVLDNPPFNFIIHNSPPREQNTPHYHWHIEIMPKLTRVAGFEWGTGFYINPTAPEEAAKFLKDAEI
jgi:UDPglucose--hexose-1-phosphate uridylyltransferase